MSDFPVGGDKDKTRGEIIILLLIMMMITIVIIIICINNDNNKNSYYYCYCIAWLDKKGFTDLFKEDGGWEADSILGLEKEDFNKFASGINGLKLWSFLNTTRTILKIGLFRLLIITINKY